ncbi:hypothetical protein PG990_007821 [Apiospora arundinis]
MLLTPIPETRDLLRKEAAVHAKQFLYIGITTVSAIATLAAKSLDVTAYPRLPKLWLSGYSD